MKTDSIFYRLFQELPSIFFELIDNPPETAENYNFSSVEIKQTAFRIDGVFIPTQTEDNPIYEKTARKPIPSRAGMNRRSPS